MKIRKLLSLVFITLLFAIGFKVQSYADELIDLSAEGVVIEVSEEIYTGEAIIPNVKVTYNDTDLSVNEDYTLDFENNINAGEAELIITGIGQYTGEVTKTFEIKPALIREAEISSIPDVTYTGDIMEPQPEVVMFGIILELDKDYTITYSSNVDAGKAYVYIIGKGNFTGRAIANFYIKPTSIENAIVSDISDKTYNGIEREPKPTVTVSEKKLKLDCDYTLSYKNHKNAGTATITITGINNYTGSTTKTFTIKPLSLKNINIEDIPAKTYTGKLMQPKLDVWGDDDLVEGKDYTLSYKNNLNVGTASVVVKGIGNYTGERIKKFKIKAVSLKNATIASVSKKTYTGSKFTPKPQSTYKDKALKINRDYTLSYKNNKNAGTATIIATGKGNYTGKKTRTFKISAASLSKAKIATIAKKTFTGAQIKPSPKVTFGNKTLKKGTDYKLSYKNNRNAGTATVIATGKGNFTGKKSKTFKIVAASIKKAKVGKVEKEEYSGTKYKPTPTVKLGSNTLKKGTDYTLSYKNNKNAGTATIIIKGKKNCTGEITKTFTIQRASIAEANVSSIADQTYTGNAIEPNPTVTFYGDKLTRGKDYSVSYLNNVAVGTATIRFTGIGNFKDSLNKTFTIKAAPKPTPTPDPDPEPDPQPSTDYVGNRNSKIFHYSSCASAKRIKASNRVTGYTRAEFISMGYRACETCRP